MAVTQFQINPSDGWVAVTSAGTDFVRIRSSTPGHAFYVTSAGSLPAATAVGYKVGPSDDDDFWVNVPNADNYYVKTIDEQPQGNKITVFSIPSTP